MRSFALTGSGACRPVSVRCHSSPFVPGKLPCRRFDVSVIGCGAPLPSVLLLPCVAMSEQRGRWPLVPRFAFFATNALPIKHTGLKQRHVRGHILPGL